MVHVVYEVKYSITLSVVDTNLFVFVFDIEISNLPLHRSEFNYLILYAIDRVIWFIQYVKVLNYASLRQVFLCGLI